MICSQAHRHTVLGAHDDIMWPAIITEEHRPADESLIPNQGDRVPPIILQGVQNSRNSCERETDAVGGIASACNYIAVTKRNPLEVGLQCRPVSTGQHL